MPLGPTNRLQRLREAFLLDIDELVVEPRWPLIALDHECPERDGLLSMWMIEAAARLPIHQRDFAMLGFIVGDDCGEVGGRQVFACFLADDGAEGVKNLPLIKSELTIAANLSDGVVEVVENYILLRFPISGVRAMRLAHSLRCRLCDPIEERLHVGCLAVR